MTALTPAFLSRPRGMTGCYAGACLPLASVPTTLESRPRIRRRGCSRICSRGTTARIYSDGKAFPDASPNAGAGRES